LAAFKNDLNMIGKKKMIYSKIFELAANTKTINTHSHHLEDAFFIDFNLEKLLLNTYLSWCEVSFGNSKESRQNYLNKVRFKSYYRWLQKALKEIYKIREDLSSENWDYYSGMIFTSHKDNAWHKSILKKYCNYEKVILDAYWNPGSNNQDSGVFLSVFRINPLFFGYSKNDYDHNGHNVNSLYNREFGDIDNYLLFVRKLITEKTDNGCIALKNAMAYDRTLDYEISTKDKAQRVFKGKEYITEENIRLFQDYLFDEICKLAAELNIPVQCHTGMGLLEKTNALNMLNIIKNNPDTKFVLFHGGFPWTADILGLMHANQNVYSDICWLPLLSPTTSEYVLHQLIEVVTSDKICWGCDTWTSEESYGARLALNDTLASVLSEKIEKKYFSMNDAEYIIKNILFDNPKTLYKV
jgi:uncharacterized protein